MNLYCLEMKHFMQEGQKVQEDSEKASKTAKGTK